MARRSVAPFFLPPPMEVKGGIRAQSQDGNFGHTWWAQRWVEVLNGFQIGDRLERGQKYARTGQVLSIEFGDGTVRARVQGSRPQPYEIEIRVKPLPEEVWKKVAAGTAVQALYASKLLAGEMPQKMEDLFVAAGATLFPKRYTDMMSRCSCPDWLHPCKHAAAVYYLLGEEFDRDPFLIFRMRGMQRETFIAMLGGERDVQGGAANQPGEGPVHDQTAEALPPDPAAFWKAAAVTEEAQDGPHETPPPVTEAALPRRLGKFPFWRGSENLAQFLDGVYVAASEHAADVLAATAERTSSVQRD
jgi:uncharacterized Zn finger protein